MPGSQDEVRAAATHWFVTKLLRRHVSLLTSGHQSCSPGSNQHVSMLSAAERTYYAASLREPVLFSGTIRDNIAGWRDVTDEEVEAAAAAANAAVFINRAPDRYATKARSLS